MKHVGSITMFSVFKFHLDHYWLDDLAKLLKIIEPPFVYKMEMIIVPTSEDQYKDL